MLEELKRKVYEANMELSRKNLITYTWGSANGVDREKGLFVMKPNEVNYDVLKPSSMVVMDLEGNKVEGEMNPSSDIATHVGLYNVFKEIGDIVHTHSPHAAAWAQTDKVLPRYDATHVDYFYGEIPCARSLTAEEIGEGYEMNAGRIIIETFRDKNPTYIPTVLCKNHGPFTWGKDTAEAVHNAVILKEVVRMNFMTEFINPQVGPAPQCMQDRHFIRKHGSNAYYGQGKQMQQMHMKQ